VPARCSVLARVHQDGLVFARRAAAARARSVHQDGLVSARRCARTDRVLLSPSKQRVCASFPPPPGPLPNLPLRSQDERGCAACDMPFSRLPGHAARVFFKLAAPYQCHTLQMAGPGL
jgi:hypothetical protein